MTNVPDDSNRPEPDSDAGRELRSQLRHVKALTAAEHDEEACRLRTEGWTHVEIAAKQGVTKSTVQRRIQRALKSIPMEAVNELRRVQDTQLDRLYREAMGVLAREHIVVNNGNVIRDPRTGEPMLDDAPVLHAINTLLKVQERRARLYGLDAPSRALTMTASEEAVDRQIRILLKESGQYDGEAPGFGDDDRGSVGEAPALAEALDGEEG